MTNKERQLALCKLMGWFVRSKIEKHDTELIVEVYDDDIYCSGYGISKNPKMPKNFTKICSDTKYRKPTQWMYVSDLQFDQDWTWLMKAKEHIEGLENGRFEVTIKGTGCSIYDSLEDESFGCDMLNCLESVFECLSDFALFTYLKQHR